MNLRLRSIAVGASALAMAGGLAVVAAGPASAAGGPSWQPEAKAVGTLTFYNASGNPITGGNVTDSPIAAYVQGSTADTSHTVATLYAATPVSGTDPGTWGSDQLSTSTTYPNASAPGALGTSTLPLVHGISGDSSLADQIADFPNTDTSTTDGFGGVYELRLKTGVSNTVWQVADIQVTGTTWSVIYPTAAAATSTTTTLTANPATGATAGANVTLTATVSPSTATGTVQFKENGTAIGSPATVSGGTAAVQGSFPSAATYALTADFTPSSNAFTASQGTLSYVVGSAASGGTSTSTALGVTPTSGPALSPVSLTATVTPSTAAGSVQFFDGTTSLGSSPVASGSANLSYSQFAAGGHSLTAVFTPTDATQFAGSTSSAVTFTASAATGPAAGNVQAEVDSGQLTITSPYSTSNPFDLGHLARNGGSTALSTSAQFGSSGSPIQVTDTRAGNLPWSAFAQTTDFSSGANVINGQNLGLTNVQTVLTPGNALTASSVSVFDNAAAAAVAPGATGTAGLKGLAKFASASAGNGTIGFFGTLTLNAPTSTAAGTYFGTLTFTVG
jgi:Bacterial Ig-like domain (group 3)